MSARGGIDLGGTKIQAVVVEGDDAHVLGSSRRPTPTTGGPEKVAAEVGEALREAAGAAGVETSELEGIGIGVPGQIDVAAGVVEQAPNLNGWSQPFPLAARLAETLGCQISLGNDVNVATDAEFTLGAGRPYSSLLGVFWGTGVGGGIILDGRPWEGRGAAAEIGHVVVKPGGARCGCGRRGCMEAYAGRGNMEVRARKAHADGQQTELFKIMRQRGRDRLTSGVWARALDRGDHLAHQLVSRAVDALGIGVASVNNVLDVEAIIIGGGLGLRLGVPYVE